MRFTRLALVASTFLGAASCSQDPAEQTSAALISANLSESCAGPVLGAVSPIVVGCSPVDQTLTPPSVTACSPVTITAVLLTIENGTPVVKPLVDNVLPADVSSGIVRWTATDAAGNSAFADAVIDGSSSFSVMATQSLVLRDRVQVLDGAGVPTSVSSAGCVSVGVQAQVGNIDSAGGVRLQDRAHVFGHITTAGTLSKQNLATIDGPVVEHGSPILGATPSVPSVGALPSTWSSVEPDQTVTLAAGTHDNVRVSSRATLRLAPGLHVFASLSIDPHAQIVADEGAANIVVAGDFSLHGSIAPAAGSWVQLTLLGTGTYIFETNFTGTVIAPNATLVLGAGHQLSFVGSYYARDVEIRPDVVVRCR